MITRFNKRMIQLRFIMGLGLVLGGLNTYAQVKPIWESAGYKLYTDSLVQGKNVARAISSTELVSNYQSPANEFKSSVISFKFSINGKDNEMLSGTDHHFNCDTKILYCETPLIEFGTQLKEKEPHPVGFLKPGAKLKIRLDMRHVLKEFNTKGYYTTFDGTRIYKEDFKGVYVAGSSLPMTWDFDNLVNHPDLKLNDDDGDGIFEVVLSMNVKEQERQTLSHWKMSKDLSAYPQYHSDNTMSNALYNLSLEEMVNAVEPDSTFRTGKEWAGVWTRDISYSIILSMAYLQPRVAMFSLLRKVSKKKKIIQDTGTGGAWPISTDRLIWAIAAWEIYKVTGDEEWLRNSYEIILNSINDDLLHIYDKETGLVKGESSFLDWREQTYPKWMQPADIFESECLGTNAVHYKANRILAQMATLLNKKEVARKHNEIADKIKAGINQYLWQPRLQYYGQYLYGRGYKILSPKAEALGEALCVLFDIAGDKERNAIVSHTPVTAFGIPCIFPEIPNIPPYHNNAVWPFVQSYWMWAAAKAGNEKAVMESIAAIYRPTALFVTNKENLVATNGDYSGTQINSSNMLWSLSGNISIVHHLLFGIRFEEDGLGFYPFVPYAFRGNRSLQNFKYRKAVLNIEMKGFGNEIRSFAIDGKISGKNKIPSDLAGEHSIEIILADKSSGNNIVNKQPVIFSPAMPLVVHKGAKLSWNPVADAVKYRVLKNGKLFREIQACHLSVSGNDYSEYQVIAVTKDGIESFASEPVINAADYLVYEAEDFAEPASYSYKGYTGKGFVETSTDKNKQISIPVVIDKDGNYLLDIRYSNGNGPSNTENKCAIRTVFIDDKVSGTLVFPQRGKEEWSNWGFSNQLKLKLSKGPHVIKLEYLSSDENMNGVVNQAMLDCLRLVKE